MAQVLLATVLVLALLEPAISSSHGTGPHWAYKSAHDVLGPAEWSQSYEHCGGHSQSPVNIYPYYALYDRSLTEFDLNDYSRRPTSMTLKNVGGHTVEVEVGESPEIRIRGGGLIEEYKLAQFHFHWGHDNTQGSEHRVNGRAAPMEMHMVHTRPASYKNYEPELAVLSFLFEVGNYNTEFDRFLNYFSYVRYSDQEKILPSFSVANLLPRNAGYGVYYRYKGSLTTPPCSETVVWTVFKDRIQISSSQLNRFRNLRAGARPADDDIDVPRLQDNFRPLQYLNGRRIYTNEERSHTVHKRSPHHLGHHLHGQPTMPPEGHAHGGHTGHQGQGHPTPPSGGDGGHTGHSGQGHPTTPPEGHGGHGQGQGHGHGGPATGHWGGHSGGGGGGHGGQGGSGHNPTTPSD